MDKEAQEKIASRIIVDCGYDSEYPCPHNMPLNDCLHEDKELCMWQLEQAEGILNALFELGYRKLPKDKPPLLRGAEIDTRLCNYARNFSAEDMTQIVKIVEFQWNICIEHYEGK